MSNCWSKLLRALTLVAVLAFISCGGGESATNTPAPTSTSAPTATPAPTATLAPTAAPAPTATLAPTAAPAPTAPPVPTQTPGNIASSLEDVKLATIRIEAQGSFVEPEVGLQLNVGGGGSGFFIDESGIAVTNNHVVTGAAFLKVWVSGETTPRNAKILGVSECSDLAVIDVDGDGFTYLEWYEGSISTGLDVYTAGFPLGDPEFTLTRGIISKARADGETNWASVDNVIEHDATINPGNSGGPLVTEDGKLIAVNYAAAASTSQYFAIARDEALEIIEPLRAGQDMTSIGVNGQAVNDGEGVSGIWVSSVKSGSPADQSGLEGGDIVTTLEGFVLATDGTMADYCDILRSHNPEDTLSIEVLRFATEEVLEGQINGRELETSFSFAQELGGEVEGTATEGYSGYTLITDEEGAIQVEIPLEWDDTDGGAWLRDGQEVGAKVAASTNLSDYYNTWSTPGIFFGASKLLAQSFDEVAFLDELEDYSNDCVYEGRYEYEDPAYTGLYDLYSDCGDTGSQLINIVATPESREFIIWVQTQIVSDADLEALDRIINSFEVVGELPAGEVTSTVGPGDGPVPMASFEGSSFSVEYPQAWQESSIEILGLAMVFFGTEELGMDEMQDLDIEGLAMEDPIVVFMVVPEDMAGEMGVDDIDQALDDFDDTIPEENVETIEQGDTTIGGATGKFVTVRGDHPDMGFVGVHMVVARTPEGTVVVLIAMTPEQDREQNMEIFAHMHETFTLK